MAGIATAWWVKGVVAAACGFLALSAALAASRTVAPTFRRWLAAAPRRLPESVLLLVFAVPNDFDPMRPLLWLPKKRSGEPPREVDGR